MAKGVIDPAGRNPKDRFVVLIRDFHDGDPFAFGVAVTSSFEFPLTPSQVPLPFARHGKCGTGLVKESVADCDWIVQLAPIDITRRGAIPTKELNEIVKRVTAKGQRG